MSGTELIAVARVTTITVRRLDQAIQDQLRVRAAKNRRSMEAEIRAILADAVGPTEQPGHDQQEAG